MGFQDRLKVNKAVAVGKSCFVLVYHIFELFDLTTSLCVLVASTKGITVFFANVVMTFAVMGLGVIGASTLSGIPIFPSKP